MSKVGALTQWLMAARRRRGQPSKQGARRGDPGRTFGADITGEYRGRATYKPSPPDLPHPDDRSMAATRARMEALGFDPDSPVLYHTTRFGPELTASQGMSFAKADRGAQRAIFTSMDPKSTEPYGSFDNWLEAQMYGGNDYALPSITVPLRHRGELIEVDYPDYVRDRFSDADIEELTGLSPYEAETARTMKFRRDIMSKMIDDFSGKAEGMRIRNMEDVLPLEYELKQMDNPDFEWPDQTVIFNPADLRVPWAGFRLEPDDVKINDLGYRNGGALRMMR